MRFRVDPQAGGGRQNWNTLYSSPYIHGDDLPRVNCTKENYQMNGTLRSEIAADKARGAYPVVYFDDLALEPSNPETCDAQESWPEALLTAFEKAFEAAAQGALLLHREMIDIAQRNVNASFGLQRKLAGAKNLGEILDLEAAYWRNKFGALMGQAEELRALTTKTAADMAGPIDEHVPSSIDVRKALLTPLSD
jgi:hypothetical protein